MTQWTSEIIRQRFIEGADTESRLPRAGNGSSGGYWPQYVHSFEDMNGWGTQRLAEEREMRLRRIPPSSAAISRHDEVMDWTIKRIHDEQRRRLVWAFAICKLNGWSFAAKCRQQGWNRITAYERLKSTFERIAMELRNDGVSLRLPDQKWALQEQAIEAIDSGTVGAIDEDAPKSPRAVIQPGAIAIDLLKTDVDMQEFAKHLRAVNRVRRKEQDRQKRRFLGIEQGAA